MYRNVLWLISFLLVLLATAVAVLLAVSLVAPENGEHNSEKKSPKEKSLVGKAKEGSLELSLSLPKRKYKLDEELSIQLTLTNKGKTQKTLSFSDAQRFDFWVDDPDFFGDRPLRVWRWSLGMVFGQVTGQKVLKPGQKLDFKASWDQKWQGLPPGKYPHNPPFPGRYILFGIIGKESQVHAGPAKVTFEIEKK